MYHPMIQNWGLDDTKNVSSEENVSSHDTKNVSSKGNVSSENVSSENVSSDDTKIVMLAKCC